MVGAAVIGTFYTVGANTWDSGELVYEGAFALVACVIITVVGAALLRIGKMQEKWRVKIAAAVESPIGAFAFRGSSKGAWFKHFAEKYAMFILPFITVLREGIEAIVFVAGVSFTAPASAFPLPVVVGLIAGILVGYLLYKGGSTARLQLFLIASTCLLYLVAAGLMSRAVWSFEMNVWNKAIGSADADELGSGPGSYDISQSVWHVNVRHDLSTDTYISRAGADYRSQCCNPQTNGGSGWGVFNAILGWTNSATYGSVLSYNLYWLVVMAGFASMRYQEVKGHWPLMKPKSKPQDTLSHDHRSESGLSAAEGGNGKIAATEKSAEVAV